MSTDDIGAMLAQEADEAEARAEAEERGEVEPAPGQRARRWPEVRAEAAELLESLEQMARGEGRVVRPLPPTHVAENWRHAVCAHCGRQCGDLEGGWATVGVFHVCHPNVLGRPDCYRRITIYGEPVGALIGSDDSREIPI